MKPGNQRKIVRLLGVGFDAEDGHVRITNSENYDVLMGSDESHEYIQELIRKIEDALEARGMTLDDLTPEEFGEFVQSVK
jgi:hypothetical protein